MCCQSLVWGRTLSSGQTSEQGAIAGVLVDADKGEDEANLVADLLCDWDGRVESRMMPWLQNSADVGGGAAIDLKEESPKLP